MLNVHQNPMVNKGKVIGVTEMINKNGNEPFLSDKSLRSNENLSNKFSID